MCYKLLIDKLFANKDAVFFSCNLFNLYTTICLQQIYHNLLLNRKSYSRNAVFLGFLTISRSINKFAIQFQYLHTHIRTISEPTWTIMYL